MKNVLVEVDTLDHVVWPRKCIGCGTELTSEVSSTFEINIRKGARVAFSRSTPKKMSINLCDRCSWRISIWDKFGKLGGIISFISETMKRRIEGVKCTRRSKKEWVFSFRNLVFRNEFTEVNIKGKHKCCLSQISED